MFDRGRIAEEVKQLAAEGVCVGTSSWKYPGWIGQVYERGRYAGRGGFSPRRFEAECLREYAEVFPAVCVDATYYRMPGERELRGLAERVPPGFRFGFKVTDRITVKTFPRLERHGVRAGRGNPEFLRADLFAEAFLGPLESIRDRVGVVILEFSRFHRRDFERGRDFVNVLDNFLQEIPGGWPLAVEVRNRTFLEPPYFEALRRRGVAHVFNQWSAMPPVEDQLALEGSVTADFVAARFLLSPGRVYEGAVRAFAPYDQTREVDEGARAAGGALIRAGRSLGGRPSFLFVNNRLEGNAPNTIAAMLHAARCG